jgi:hypothetical protein
MRLVGESATAVNGGSDNSLLYYPNSGLSDEQFDVDRIAEDLACEPEMNGTAVSGG